MNRRLQVMYDRAFESAFLRLRHEGISKDAAIQLAESEAQEGLDRYCDEKMDERRLEK